MRRRPSRRRGRRTQRRSSHLEDGLLYNVWWPPGQPVTSRTRNQLVVPAGTWRREILVQYHDGPLGGTWALTRCMNASARSTG